MNWSEEDKELLLEVLQKHGVNDLQRIALEFPHKSINNIRQTIDYYEAAARKSVINDTNHEWPLDNWLNFMKGISPNQETSDDVVTAVKCLAYNEKHTESDVNLGDCYEYLADLMSGKAPKQLDNASMCFIMSCQEKLSQDLKAEDTSKEEQFLRNLSMAAIQQKSYAGKKISIVTDPAVNILKIPAALLKMNKDI